MSSPWTADQKPPVVLDGPRELDPGSAPGSRRSGAGRTGTYGVRASPATLEGRACLTCRLAWAQQAFPSTPTLLVPGQGAAAFGARSGNSCRGQTGRAGASTTGSKPRRSPAGGLPPGRKNGGDALPS